MLWSVTEHKCQCVKLTVTGESSRCYRIGSIKWCEEQ